MGLGSSSDPPPQDKHILVIGAGYGSIQLTNTLLKKGYNFTVVDTKDCFHHNVGSVRAVVEPGFAKKTTIPYEACYGKHFRRGKVIEIDVKDKAVKLEDGTELTYDILIIATGSYGPMKEWEGTAEEIVSKYSKICEEVKKSESVVIIGGGAVGVEVAAEFGTIYPEKKVTIVHGDSQLVSKDATAKFLSRVSALLKQMHVEVILDEFVENFAELPNGVHGSYEVKTSNGKIIKADIVLKCTGLKVNTSAYGSSLKEYMEENGALKVNEFLQVEGHKEVFAFGDCCNTKEAKLAYVAKLQADVVAKNVYNSLFGRSLEPWKSDYVKFFMGLSMGSRHGVAAMKNGFMLPEFIIVSLKSKDMMTGQFFKEMNQKVPT